MTAEVTTTALPLLVGSLSLTAKAWSTIKKAGACACCAARLAGCRDPAVYACNERDLRDQLDARFCDSSSRSRSSVGAAESREVGDRCCPLCLGLLRDGIPVRVAPRPRRSAEIHGDHNRVCEQAGAQLLRPLRRPSEATEADEDETSPAADRKIANNEKLTSGNGNAATTTTADPVPVPAARGSHNGNGTDASGSASGYSRACIADAIVECIAARGYTVTSFGITAAVPACLLLRDAAFLEAGCGVPPDAATTTSPTPHAVTSATAKDSPPCPDGTERPASMAEATTTTTTTIPATATLTIKPPAVVPVKEAFKIGLARALQDRLLSHTAGDATTVVAGAEERDAAANGAPAVSSPAPDQESDFLVEVTVTAREADAHAVTELLGGLAPTGRAGVKTNAWRGGGGGGWWAQKRQRREEHRNPGLTVGAVKKGLATLDDAGRGRMRRWVEGLLEQGGSGHRRYGDEKAGDKLVAENGPARLGESEGCGHQDANDMISADEVVAAEPRDSENVRDSIPAGLTRTGRFSKAVCAFSNGSSNSAKGSSAAPGAVAVEATTEPPLSTTRGDTLGGASPANGSGAAAGQEALCDVAIRRQSIHFWGRYTKHSRSVPQTPWMKGFFSVQEAVSEPFEAFSGCVEGLLHGAGREDVNVRMLGNGRPFCLELVDSLRTADEIAARLPSLAAAINAAGGAKNAGGGVAVSRLRVAGPGELPSDVQAVGEGKRKHYRCVVWVSRAVQKEELEKIIHNTREELVVQQATPIRVLHRRTLMDRPRSVIDMRAEWINEHFFQLDLTTSAGTYVKEFVHGDLGRTVPSIGSLLCCRADILQLDVMEVEDKWSAQEREREATRGNGEQNCGEALPQGAAARGTAGGENTAAPSADG